MTQKKYQPRHALIAGLIVICTGCNALQPHRTQPEPLTIKEPPETIAAGLPGKQSFRVSQFLFLHDFDLSREQPLFRELAELREQIITELKLPPASAIVSVYLFDDQEHYEAFMLGRYPDLPKRRAFFVAQPRAVGGGEDLMVYTFWGKRVREDLRHELTHAVLHSVLRDVPLWLDEGIAEYFEAPPEWKGLHPTHLEQVRQASATQAQLDLARLEALTQIQQMTPADYHEAWAWVHLMLRDRPEARALLLGYLQRLRVPTSPQPLSLGLRAIYASPHEALSGHLAKLSLIRTMPRVQGSPRIQ